MNLRQLIAEKISITTARDEIASGIHSVIKDVVENIGMQFHTNFFDQPEVNYDQLYEFLQSNLMRVLTRRIQTKLISTGRKILELGSNSYFHVDFNDSNVGGAAYYDRIEINKKPVITIAKYIVDGIIDSLHDNAAIDDGIITDVKYASRMISNTEIDMDYYKIIDSINELISVFIHELVHIKQHSTQDMMKPTEYRSYATKDKERFNKAISNIHAGNASEEDMRLYRASPQEIPAFAHNAALDILHSIVDTNTDNITEINDIKYYIEVLSDYIRGGRFATSYISHHMPYYSKTFNKPGTKEYQVFKRFYKIVAQELMQYRDKLQQHLTTILQKQKEQEDYEKWIAQVDAELNDILKDY